MATLRDIVGTACDELDYDTPAAMVGSTDPDARQFLALTNAAGRELVRAHDWAALQVLWTFPTVATQSDYALPSDYARLIDDTGWDRSTRWPLVGPVTPQTDRAQRESGIATLGLRRDFRLTGTGIRLFPTPSVAGEVMVFEYQSKFWTASADGTSRSDRFTSDLDTCSFHFDLMVKELKWRWLAAKKMDAAGARAERDTALEAFIAADLGGGVLDMGGGCSDDWGGQVVAATTPNFTLGTGDGAGLFVD